MGRPARFALLRDHSDARRLARRLERSSSESAARDRRALLTYWYGSGAAHLRAQDHVLLSAWKRHGGAAHPLTASMRGELARLAVRVGDVARTARPEAAELRRIGRELTGHLDRQERELFGVVERAVPREALVEVDEALEVLRRF